MRAAVIADGITQALTDWIAHHGVYAVFVVMAIDALLPAGGELTMLVAGALAAGAIADSDPVLLGHTLPPASESYLVLSLAGTLGYLLGSLVGWAIGRWGGRPLLERHGRWLHLDAEQARPRRALVRPPRPRRRLPRAAHAGRPVLHLDPGRPAESPLVPYTLLTLAGSAIWCFGFAGAGWALGSRYDQVHHAFTGVEVALVAAGVLAAGAIVAGRRRARARHG